MRRSLMTLVTVVVLTVVPFDQAEAGWGKKAAGVVVGGLAGAAARGCMAHPECCAKGVGGAVRLGRAALERYGPRILDTCLRNPRCANGLFATGLIASVPGPNDIWEEAKSATPGRVVPIPVPRRRPGTGAPPPPGDCEPDDLRFLSEQVQKNCKNPNVMIQFQGRNHMACVEGMSSEQLTLLTVQNLKCAKVRERRESICYRGGYATHRKAIRETWKAFDKCRDRMWKDVAARQ